MQNDLFEFDDAVTTTEIERDYEKTCYGKVAYKRVQRLRRRGKRRGIDVPVLGYELTKPEKPRIAFWVVAIVSAALFVGIMIGLGFLYNELVKAFSDLGGLGEFIKVLFKPDVLRGSLGLSALPGILMVVVYFLVLVLFAVPFIAAVYFFRFVRDAFYMANCSKEEFAKGSIISSRILGLVTVLVVATVIFIILLSLISAAGAKLYIGLIFGALAVSLVGFLALIIVEKIKCGKWFEGLEEDKRQNYLAHERALRRVKSRLKMEKRFWEDLGK